MTYVIEQLNQIKLNNSNKDSNHYSNKTNASLFVSSTTLSLYLGTYLLTLGNFRSCNQEMGWYSLQK